jgi:molecular chaperone DnaK
LGACIGIDLGTTNSAVAVIIDGKPQLIPNSRGKRITPSLVAFYNQEIVVGETAKALLLSGVSADIACFVGSVKRLMGTDVKIRFRDQEYSPQQIAALILKQLKTDAERYLGEPAEEAVISVPAYFNDLERQATIDAGTIAGFKVEKIINEPTAAALAYGLEHSRDEQRIVVYDLGGGTFDLTILSLYEGIIEVKASIGDKQLGGDDFDRDLIRYVLQKYQEVTGRVILAPDGGEDLMAGLGRGRYYLLKMKCEAVKQQLSEAERAQFLLTLRSADDREVYHLDLEITRSEFEALIAAKIVRTITYLEEALALANWEPAMVDRVLLVGGSTKIPLVAEFITRKFGRRPQLELNPDEAVALGAAVDAGLKQGAWDESQALIVMDITPFSWGTSCIDRYDGEMRADVFARLIMAQTKIPCTGEEIFYTVEDNQTRIDVSIYSGEANLVAENILVREFIVAEIPPAPAGREAVHLEFTIDINGNLVAKATVLSTGQTTQIMVKSALNRMSPAEINQSREQLRRDWQKTSLA